MIADTESARTCRLGRDGAQGRAGRPGDLAVLREMLRAGRNALDRDGLRID